MFRRYCDSFGCKAHKLHKLVKSKHSLLLPDLMWCFFFEFRLYFHLNSDLTSEKRDQYVTFTRYCLYFGLCVAVCIIFQNSTWLAAIFGIAVGIYISFSEYWLQANPPPKTPSQKILEAAMGMKWDAQRVKKRKESCVLLQLPVALIKSLSLSLSFKSSQINH